MDASLLKFGKPTLLILALGLVGIAQAEVSFTERGSSTTDVLVTADPHDREPDLRRSNVNLSDLRSALDQQDDGHRKLAELQRKLEEQQRTIQNLSGNSSGSSRELDELERKVDKLAQLERQLDSQDREIDSLRRELEQLSRRIK
ncbi:MULTISPECIES: hypothetical protein [unclassified Pseudomonas]|uniref:hypothetical protein n=1 Tax=unclassified Pseudomonas TaxID=196821 RepID=UPI00244B0C3A|nr:MULTISPECIES: hypothetical protein [unclassified Pseudomonas]MDG9922218.1 hypothetical protein [Pseudomonas sp. GD04045]MDH0033689.1 hypothetical protein [Pseudomonas sp. GD04019]